MDVNEELKLLWKCKKVRGCRGGGSDPAGDVWGARRVGVGQGGGDWLVGSNVGGRG